MAVDRSPSSDETGEPQGDLVDRPLQEEIELVGALVAAVSARRRALSEAEIDQLLGVEGPEAGPPHGGEGPADAPDHG